MTVLVPVRYPLTDHHRRAIEKAVELISDDPHPELLFILVNLLHQDEPVSRRNLREAVEAEFGTLPANYVVRDGFLSEGAIPDKAVRQGVDYIVHSERRYSAWQQLLRDILDIGVGLESFLAERLDAEIHVVTDQDPSSTAK